MPERWSEAAEIRKKQIENYTDITFHKIFVPEYVELFKEYKPKKVIDIGAGTGHLAKYLEPYCESVTAIEPSVGMYRVAMSTLENNNIELLNLSSNNYYPEELYDLGYSHMCAHAVEDLVEFFSSIRKLLKTKNRFIFTIPHPCFYHLYKDYFGEDYIYINSSHKNINLTISKDEENIMAGVPFHHHPLSSYIDSLCKSKFVVTNFIEPWPDNDLQREYEKPWAAPRYCIFVCEAI